MHLVMLLTFPSLDCGDNVVWAVDDRGFLVNAVVFKSEVQSITNILRAMKFALLLYCNDSNSKNSLTSVKKKMKTHFIYR